MRTVTISLDGITAYNLYSKPKTFKSGSRGYYVWGKAEDSEGKRSSHLQPCGDRE